MDETNLKIDIPVVQAPRPGPTPYQALLRLNGGGPLPAYLAARGARMGGLEVGPRMGGIAAGVGAAAGMGAPPMGLGAGVGNNAFMFGAGQAHQFAPQAFGALDRAGLNLHAQAQDAMMRPAAMPLAQAGGARGRAAPVKAAMPAGGRRSRRKGR